MLESLGTRAAVRGPGEVREQLPQNAAAFGPTCCRGNLYRQLRRRTFDVCEIVTLGGDDIVEAADSGKSHGYAIKLRRNGRRCWSIGFVDDFFDVTFAGLARPTNIDGARWHPSEMALRIGGCSPTTISRSSPSESSSSVTRIA